MRVSSGFLFLKNDPGRIALMTCWHAKGLTFGDVRMRGFCTFFLIVEHKGSPTLVNTGPIAVNVN